MDVSTLSAEFLDLLKKFRSSVNQEIQNLERSYQDIDVLEKTVEEINSLLGSEGLSLFVGQLKDVLETVITEENKSAISENNDAATVETGQATSETLKTIKSKKDNDDSAVGKIKEIRVEKTDANKKCDLLKSKEEWALQYAKLLCKLLEPVLPVLTVDRNLELLFYLENLKPCSHTNMLADTLHVLSCTDRNTKEITFKCYEDSSRNKEANINAHSIISRRIYEQMMNLITLHSEPQRKPHIPKITWKSFIIRVNSEGESFMRVKALFNVNDVSVLIKTLKEEFESDKAKDCNLRSLVLAHSVDQFSSHVVLGKQYIVENMWNMNFVIDSTPITIWNPIAMRNLSKTLYKLAKPNKNQTGILFFDTIMSAVPLLCMADCSRKVVLLHANKNVPEFMTFEAERNNMQNFSCSSLSFPPALLTHFPECSEVCLVMCGLNRFAEKDVAMVTKDEKISKIIFFSTFENIFCMRKLVNFLEFDNVKDPFIITRLVPVDLCPFGETIEMLLLLERTSCLVGKVMPNNNFSLEIFNSFKMVERSIATTFHKKMRETSPKQQQWQEEILFNLSAQQQFIHGMSNSQPSNKAQHQVTDNISYIPPWKKAHLQVTDEMPKAQPTKNLDMGSVEIENMSTVVNKEENISTVVNTETEHSLKGCKEISSMGGSKNEELFVPTFKVPHADEVCLDDLDESQEIIMIRIIEELDNCNQLNLDKEYHTAVNFKKEFVNLETKRLSDTLITVLPHLVSKAVPGYAFKQLDMVPCPSTKTLSEKYFIILEEKSKTGKIVHTMNSNNEMIQLRRPMSYKAKNICKLVANFILKTKYPMFNEQGQGFWCIIIRINSKGNPWLLVEGNVDTVEEASKILSDLEPKLKSFMRTGLGPRMAQDLRDVFLSIFTKTDTQARAVLGDTMLYERVGPFNIKFHGKRYPYYNPFGMMGLANEVLKLAAVDRRWGVVQVGCGCGIESLQLARECAEFYLLRQPGTLNIYFFAKENGVRNFVYNPVNHAQAMESVIVKDMARHSNVCVLYDLSEPVGFFGASVLRNNFHVKRIIYVINTSNNDWIKEVVSCCQNRTDWREPFVVTKFASVDMAPYEDNVKMMCVLERESSAGSNLRLNYNFSVKAVEEFLAG